MIKANNKEDNLDRLVIEILLSVRVSDEEEMQEEISSIKGCRYRAGIFQWRGIVYPQRSVYVAKDTSAGERV